MNEWSAQLRWKGLQQADDMFSGQNRLSVGNAESRTYFSYGTFLGIIVTEVSP